MQNSCTCKSFFVLELNSSVCAIYKLCEKEKCAYSYFHISKNFYNAYFMLSAQPQREFN
jgi:hypothetical protein